MTLVAYSYLATYRVRICSHAHKESRGGDNALRSRPSWTEQQASTVKTTGKLGELHVAFSSQATLLGVEYDGILNVDPNVRAT